MHLNVNDMYVIIILIYVEQNFIKFYICQRYISYHTHKGIVIILKFYFYILMR